MTYVALGDVSLNLDAKRVPVRASFRRPGPYPYYGASGIVDWVSDFLFEGRHLLVAEDGENLRSRSTPIAFLADGQFWVNNHAHVLTARPGVSDIRYLCYQLQLIDVTGYLTGSAQPKLNRSALDSIQIWLPDLATQTAIADVLGALDDKIAVNERANSIASALSQSLLARASASVPSVPLGQLAVVPRRTVTPVPGGVWHFSLPAFDDGEVPKLEDGTDIKSAKQRLDRPSVLLSKLNPRIPRVWDAAKIPEMHPAVASTEFIVLEPRSGSTAELAAVLRMPATVDGLQSLARGTSGSHQRVSPADAMALEVPDVTQLPAELRRTLTDLATASASRRTESGRLAATRDALLPELMSGRLTVGEVA
ncbi:restriction endonuclease subunit S [Tessaracoccus defluvii]|uniref:Restriction endonuclease subunit S n=1 Tax=Tessaracoccus defluvii TaxID=1285901 RepID=A0A7H0H4W5_9ACTN|nr:restriction endonuclease subunit S [Tessaracoccus defluvii]QNP55581.1 restriction endonuclease subunit S [Tessaracoccus defluvii]